MAVIALLVVVVVGMHGRNSSQYKAQFFWLSKQNYQICASIKNDLKHKIQSFTSNLVDNAIVSYHNSGYNNDEERTIPTNETPLFPTKHFTTKTKTIRIMIYASCIVIISSKFEALACLQRSHLKSEICKY